MVNVAAVTRALGRLTLMKYFPADDAARTALVEMVCGMIHHEDQAEWLARRMLQIYREWPGPYEMRACFCGRYKPTDGINAYSEIYPDGLPIDPTAPPRPEIAAPDLRALPPGHEVTADPELEASIQELAGKCSKPPAHPVVEEFTRMVRMLREVETAPDDRREESKPPNPNFKPVTQADIARAVEELHARRASREAIHHAGCGSRRGAKCNCVPEIAFELQPGQVQ
jgi:hypothetical protein